MGMHLSTTTITASLQNGVWEATYQPTKMTTQITKVIVQGPPSSLVNIYRGTIPLDSPARGDYNSNEFLIPLDLRPGEELNVIWNSGNRGLNGQTPSITVLARISDT